MAITYKLRLTDILHFDGPVYDVEARMDMASVEVLPNCSLSIRYLDREGQRVTSTIQRIQDHDPVGCGVEGVHVVTRNSCYVFHAEDGKYDDQEIVARLVDDLEVMRAMHRAIAAFVGAFV